MRRWDAAKLRLRWAVVSVRLERPAIPDVIRAARAAGVPVSVWIRRTVQRAAKQAPGAGPTPPTRAP